MPQLSNIISNITFTRSTTFLHQIYLLRLFIHVYTTSYSMPWCRSFWNCAETWRSSRWHMRPSFPPWGRRRRMPAARWPISSTSSRRSRAGNYTCQNTIRTRIIQWKHVILRLRKCQSSYDWPEYSKLLTGQLPFFLYYTLENVRPNLRIHF